MSQETIGPRRRPFPWRLMGCSILLCLAGLLGPFSIPCRAEDVASPPAPKNYAYLMVQGTLKDPDGGRPLAGAAIQLISVGGVFEVKTNRRGVFEFEHLPLGDYDVRITAPDGRVMRTIEEIGPGIPDLRRFEVTFGRGPGTAAHIAIGEQGTAFTAPQPKVRWHRLWKELAIFFGCAAVVAL